jgi:hypothetical protein
MMTPHAYFGSKILRTMIAPVGWCARSGVRTDRFANAQLCGNAQKALTSTHNGS